MYIYSTSLPDDSTGDLQLPADIIQYIDQQVGEGFTSREEFIRAAVAHYMDYMKDAEALLKQHIKPAYT